jgi:hypothetical protein
VLGRRKPYEYSSLDYARHLPPQFAFASPTLFWLDATLRTGDVKKVRANPALDLQLQPADRVEVPQSLF